MRLQTVVRDCLFLNWAVSPDELPVPPEPLRYETHRGPGGTYVFVSAVLFRQEGLHLAGLPLPRVAHPQCNVRTYVLDGEDVPSVWLWRELVPLWMVPGARLLGGQPVERATFSFAEPSTDPASGTWRWRVEAGAALAVTAERGAAVLGEGPTFPSWNALVANLRERPRGYVISGAGQQRIATSMPAVPVWPMRATIEDASLVHASVPAAVDGSTPLSGLGRLHSAWLCPEIPFAFELIALPRALALPDQLPAAG